MKVCLGVRLGRGDLEEGMGLHTPKEGLRTWDGGDKPLVGFSRSFKNISITCLLFLAGWVVVVATALPAHGLAGVFDPGIPDVQRKMAPALAPIDRA